MSLTHLITASRDGSVRAAVAGLAPRAASQLPVVNSASVTLPAKHVGQTWALAGGGIAHAAVVVQIALVAVSTKNVTFTIYGKENVK